MQRLNTLWQIANTAAQIADLARSSQVYRFNVESSATFYLHTASAEVSVTRWAEPVIEVEAVLQAPFGWRVESDQDDAGVYFVARRRAVVGGIAGATFRVHVPETAYLVLKLDSVRLSLESVSGSIELPPGSSQIKVMSEE
jgi:hypothetical protein